MAELQGGPYGMGIHRNDAEPVCEFCGSSTMEATIDKKEGVFDPGEVTPERLNMWTWSGIAQGAKGILYWQYRNESFGLEYGFGLTELDGSPHARLEVVRAFKQVLSRHRNLLDGATLPPCRVAMAWDPRNDIVNWTAVGCCDAVKNSIKGIHKVLWHGDYPIDVLRLDPEFIPGENFDSYDAVFLPFSPFLDSGAAARLRAYVQQGGTLVAEASLAQFDDTMRVNPVVPGAGLDELFGCRRADVRTMHHQLLPAIKIGALSLRARMHKEVLKPLKGARVIGRFATGEPAVIENRVGKGRAIYIGSNPFIGYMVHDDRGLLKWIQKLLAGVERHAWTDKPDVIARVLVNDDAKIVFLLNTQSKPAAATLAVPVAGRKTPTVTEIITGRTVMAKPEKGALNLRRRLGPYGVEVFAIQ